MEEAEVAAELAEAVAESSQSEDTEEVDLSAEWASLLEESRERQVGEQIPASESQVAETPALAGATSSEPPVEEFPLPGHIVEEPAAQIDESAAHEGPDASREVGKPDFAVPGPDADFALTAWSKEVEEALPLGSEALKNTPDHPPGQNAKSRPGHGGDVPAESKATGTPRSEPRGKPEVPCGNIDSVHFSVTSPPTVSPGASFVLYLWAYLRHQRRKMIRHARQAVGGGEISIQPAGPY